MIKLSERLLWNSEPIAAGMRNELDPLIKDHVAKQRSSKLDLQHDTKGDSKDWEFIPSEEIVSKLPDPSTDEMWNALILKPDKLTGLVSFFSSSFLAFLVIGQWIVLFIVLLLAGDGIGIQQPIS